MKKNLTLIIGLAIPIVMLLLVVGTLLLPSLIVKPKHGFIYSSGDRYYQYGERFEIENGKVIKKDIPFPNEETKKMYTTQYTVSPKLYMYDPIEDASKEIILEQAQAYAIDPNIKSPDGFVFGQGGGNNGIFELFGSNRDYNAYYLKKGIVSKKIYLTNSTNTNYYYDRNIQFLGWITQ